MAVVSTIQVDVDDERFKKFAALFEKHRAAVQALPGAWGKVGDATEDASEGFTSMAAALMAQADLLQANTKEVGAMAKATATTGGLFGRLKRDTKDVAGNIKEATVSLLKWGGIITGLGGIVGAGGLFGIDRMASSVSGNSRSARGLGTSIGDQKALGLNFGRYFDAGSVAGNIVDAQTDYTKRWALNALGLGNRVNEDPAKLAPDLAINAKKVYDRGDGSQQYAQAHGLLQFFTMDELRRLHQATDGELREQKAGYGRDRTALGLDPDTARKWTDLNTQLDRAGLSIETTFIRGLTPLAPGLTHLSGAVTDLLTTLLSKPELKEFIAEAADELEHFSKYLGSSDFKADIEAFEGYVGRFTKSIGAGADWIEEKLVTLGVMKPPAGKDGYHFEGVPGLSPAVPNTPGSKVPWYLDTPGHVARRALGGLGFHQSGIDANGRTSGDPGFDPTTANRTAPGTGLDAFEQQTALDNKVRPQFQKGIFHLEGGLNADGSARISRTGAIGIGQLMPGTAKELGVDPYNTKDNVVGSTRYMAQLLEKFHGNELAAAAGYNAGPNSSAVRRFAQTGDASGLPAETKKYVLGMMQQLAAASGGKMTVADEMAATSGWDTTAGIKQAVRATGYQDAPAGGNPASATGHLDRLFAGGTMPPSAGARITVAINNATGANVQVTGAQVAR